MKKEAVNPKEQARLYGGVSQAQIEKWKDQHGLVQSLTVNVKERDYGFYFREPDHSEISLALGAGAKTPYDQGVSLLNSIYLGGDSEIMQSSRVKTAAAIALYGDFFSFKGGEVKNC